MSDTDIKDLNSRITSLEVSMTQAVTELRSSVKSLESGIQELKSAYYAGIEWYRELFKKLIRYSAYGLALILLVQLFGTDVAQKMVENYLGIKNKVVMVNDTE